MLRALSTTHYSRPEHTTKDSLSTYLVLTSNEIRSYSSYCANVGRTYFVNPTTDQEKAYNAILTAQTAAIAALVENAEISRAYEAALESLKVAY
jgi:nucleosome binding factor SPN SPT16 subunit